MWKLYLPPMLPRWFPSIILSLYIPCHSMSWWHRHGWALLLFQKRRRHSFWARPSAKTCISLRWTREGILRLALRKLNKPVWKLGVRFNMSLPFIWIHPNVGTLAFCTVRQNSLNDSIQKMDILIALHVHMYACVCYIFSVIPESLGDLQRSMWC